jgi:histidinol-phosphate phosphatase family protein
VTDVAVDMAVDIVVPATRPDGLAALRSRLHSFGGQLIAVDGRGRSPAAARNVGWRSSTAEWIAFLDDDVLPAHGWVEALYRDLADAGSAVAGIQGNVDVPLPSGRRPTDWERCVHGLESAAWATADMAYRREVLEELGGFDERFRHAYREDADLALRALRAGYELRRGRRRVTHPVGRAGTWISLRRQAGNADDVLMRAKHGPRWRAAAVAPPGRLKRHVAVAGLGVLGVVAALTGRRGLARAAATAWAAGTAELAAARIRPGPRTARELATMLATSIAIPPVAAAYAASGWARYGRLALARRRTRAVLFDRDGTLVEDVPYNGDPSRVRLMPGARAAIARCRAAQVPVAVVSNQSAIGRGLVTRADVEAVNSRIARLVGPVTEWLVCPHAPDAACSCRKPAPGLILDAAERLGVRPNQCVVVGDIGSDVEAARAAGARSVLVPTARTVRREVLEAPMVAADLCGAVELVLEGRA